MRIIVRSKGLRRYLPISLRLASQFIRFIPESVFINVNKTYSLNQHEWLSKKFLCMILQESIAVLKQYHCLEILHEESQDETFISIHL